MFMLNIIPVIIQLLLQTYTYSQHWTPAKSVLEEGVDGLKLADVQDDTKAVASRLHQTNAKVTPLVTPIYHTSTYKMDNVDQYIKSVQSVSHNIIMIVIVQYDIL